MLGGIFLTWLDECADKFLENVCDMLTPAASHSGVPLCLEKQAHSVWAHWGH